MCEIMQNILGQTQAIKILESTIASKRMPHAWIFCGPKGVGKCTTARLFGQRLINNEVAYSTHGNTGDTKDKAPLENPEYHTDHPNLHIITKELTVYSRDTQIRKRKQKNIPVEVIREFVTEPAFRSGYATSSMSSVASKVFIIDEAELLDHNAQNILLKTLEEPPEGTVLILSTTQEDRLLPTIRSRCQRIVFTALSDEDMNIWLAKRNIALNTQQTQWLLRFSQGAPGLATYMLDWNLLSWYEVIVPALTELYQHRFPVGLSNAMAKLIDDYSTAWVKVHDNASKDAANKQGAGFMFTLLAEEVRYNMYHAGQNQEILSDSLSQLDIIRKTENLLETNVNAKLAFENMVMQWADVGKSTETALWFNAGYARD